MKIKFLFKNKRKNVKSNRFMFEFLDLFFRKFIKAVIQNKHTYIDTFSQIFHLF
jgi:hypothetical protein